jgi:hypothetical protein
MYMQYVYVYAYVYVYVSIPSCALLCVSVFVCSVCVHESVYTCGGVLGDVSESLCVCVCLSVCACIHAYIHTSFYKKYSRKAYAHTGVQSWLGAQM